MSNDDRITTISELRHGLKNVNCIFIVIETGTKQQTKDGSLVRKCKVADKTGSVTFSVWNDEALAIQTGDIIKLTRGYSSVWKGGLVLYCGKYGTVEKLGEFTMVFSETPDMSLRTETPSPRSNSPPPSTLSNNPSTTRHTQPPSSVGESTNSGVMDSNNNNGFSDGRGPQPSPGTGIGRHDNHTPNTHPPASEFHEVRHHKGGRGQSNGYHPSSGHLSHHTQENNGRFQSNGHEDIRYNDRRSHHMTSHDSHMPPNNRHHPYHRHGNGWR